MCCILPEIVSAQPRYNGTLHVLFLLTYVSVYGKNGGANGAVTVHELFMSHGTTEVVAVVNSPATSNREPLL